jgi:hypothetical protein
LVTGCFTGGAAERAVVPARRSVRKAIVFIRFLTV